MKFIDIVRVNLANVISYKDKEYHVVLTAMHADHFADTFGSDPLHDIRTVDALRILSRSAATPLPRKRNRHVALGRHNRRIYNTFFKLEQNRLYLLSSYRCTRRDWIQTYESYESEKK
ncbi:hypothetical protein [Tunicatimonas pelagia]|uniref:hypothetical protein n=1 Tax=Tunicatimonas pelagia TaxID=931531 RepID=UPI00266544E6|nr:hypothetical protein [Tunicatimonas pelagia]WKN46535.1 hypothetical protein P0M28_30975 [Tunicatimonas pelagia]